MSTKHPESMEDEQQQESPIVIRKTCKQSWLAYYHLCGIQLVRLMLLIKQINLMNILKNYEGIKKLFY